MSGLNTFTFSGFVLQSTWFHVLCQALSAASAYIMNIINLK